MTGKQALRRQLRAARTRYVPSRPILVDDAFVARLTPGLVVAAYLPVGGEADPAPLVRAARQVDCTMALPHVVGKAAPLRFLAWDIGSALVTGPFGLLQPADGSGMLRPDIVLTPLVGFDRHGGRLGQGAGHYDRAFEELPDAWRVGVAWSVQQVAHLPLDPWDVPLHAIATEREWITP